jgi:hypothetical protein
MDETRGRRMQSAKLEGPRRSSDVGRRMPLNHEQLRRVRKDTGCRLSDTESPAESWER